LLCAESVDAFCTSALSTNRKSFRLVIRCYIDLHIGGTMNRRIQLIFLAACFVVPVIDSYAQQSHWAAPDDKTANFMIDMERKWAEGVCTNNGVISDLLAEDFQGTGTSGKRYNKADELRDEKGTHSAHDCALDDAKVRFFAEDVAIIYGSEHAIGKDKAHPEAKQCQVWTDTWLKREGRWQIAAAQDNKVDCK
jgi:Domain of unknown function (DUF4440)